MKTFLFTLIFGSLIISPCSGQCWKDIKCGSSHVLAIKSDGSLWAWGYNYFGQLGNGGPNNANSPFPVKIGVDTNWKTVDCGVMYSAGIQSNGTLWTWGYNNHWALGNGTTWDTNSPKRINLDTNWSRVYTGASHGLAIKTNGTLWAWGHNAYAQLGIGGTLNSMVPVQVGIATDWISASAGDNHSLAKNNTDIHFGFGSNAKNQLLNSTLCIYCDSPKVLALDTSWQSIHAGAYFSIGLKKNGTLFGWGFNLYGQLGNGTTLDSPMPTQIGLDSIWKEVATGTNHCVAIKKDGTIWAWGSNNEGQLGIGTNMNSLSPIQIGTDTNWTSIFSGGGFSMALKSDSTLWSWGNNQAGQLGDSTFISKNYPVKVTCDIIQPLMLAEEEVEYGITIFPNPTSKFVEILSQSTIEIKEILLCDFSGHIVAQYSGNTTRIDLGELPGTNYVLKIKFMDENYQTVKLTKQ